MIITRSPYNEQKANSSITSKLPIILDINTLDLYCRYILSENSSIRSGNLNSMKKLFDSIDMSVYNGDPDRLKRIEFIKRGLEAKLTAKLKERYLVESYINGGLGSTNSFIDTKRYIELNNNEIAFINNTIANNVKYLFMYNYSDTIVDICQRFKKADFSDKARLVEEFEKELNTVTNEFRRVRNDNINDTEFNLTTNFAEVVTDVWNRETSTSRRLVTGMQGFNMMVGGGCEGGRVYILFGLAAAGKSFTMLDLMLQIKKYNKHYVCHDKTKRPCIVLLTMENSIQETVQRLFSITSGHAMSQYDLDTVMSIMREQGKLVVSEEDPIDIVVKYKPNLSVDTSYLYSLYDDLEDEGYEPIALFQDHIKRIRPMFSNRDMRLDLGEIINEFKSFAVEKDIPVITDSHLNRDAAKTLEAASKTNKKDLAVLLGSSNVSESMLMVDNCDVGVIITKDYDNEANQYMGFVQIKTRTKCDLEYFAQPFVPDNSTKLQEDFYNPTPIYRESLREEVAINGLNDYFKNLQSNTANNQQKQKKESSPTYSSSSEYPMDMSKFFEDSTQIEEEEVFTVVGSPSTSYIVNNAVNEEKKKNLKPAVLYLDKDGNVIADDIPDPEYINRKLHDRI